MGELKVPVKRAGPKGVTNTVQATNLKGSFLVAFSAIAFGLMPVFAKYAYGDGANPLTFLVMRFLIAAILLTAIACIKGESLRLSIKQYLALAILGIGGYSVVAVFYFYAITRIPASIATLILYTYPIIVTLYALITRAEKIEFRKGTALSISFVGIILILDSSLRGLNIVGVFLAAGSAIFYSFYIIFSNKLLKSISPIVTTTYLLWSAAATMLLAALITGNFNLDFGYTAWLSIAAIALFSSMGGILTFQMGLKLIGPSQSSIISTLEPLVTVLASCFLFGELLTTVQVLGGGAILIAAVLLQLPRKTHNSQFSENKL